MAAVEQSDAKVDQMAVELVDGAVSDAVEKLELEALDDEPTAKALKIAGVAGLLLHRHCMPPSTSCGGIPPPRIGTGLTDPSPHRHAAGRP